MKILFSISNKGFSGAEKQLLYLILGFAEKGYDIHVCNLEGYGQFTDKLNRHSLTYTVIERRKKFDLRRLMIYKKLIESGDFDIIISFIYVANNFTRIVKILSPKTGFFHIAGERGRDFHGNSLTVLVDSLLAKKIHVIPNGVDFSKFTPKESYTISDRLELITIGRLTPQKNHSMLLGVIDRLKKEMNIILRMRIVGEGPSRTLIENRIKSMGLNDTVFLMGRREDIPELLASSDIFLLTSHFEGLPNVVMEAMITGIPVVSAAVDGVLDIIENGHNGIFVDPDNLESMVSQIIRLVKDKHLRQTIGENGRRTIIEGYNIEKMVDSYEKLFPTLNC